MRLSIGGSFKSVIKKYEKYRATLLDDLNTSLAREVKVLIKEGFKNQVDPYGNSWDIDKTGTVFDPKHNIEKAFRVVKTKDGVEVTNILDFAIYHQTGTPTLPQRMMIPDPLKGLGNWSSNIFRELENTALGRKLITINE